MKKLIRSDPISSKQRKEIGAYYTPETVAAILTRWAIRTTSNSALDPSFGGCVFLDAALEVLNSLGADQSAKQIYGVDIDPGAIRFTNQLVSQGAKKNQFPIADFLSIDPSDFPPKQFDVILGNPPYVRHHNLNGDRLASAKLMQETALVAIPGRASYWVYFVAHALRFLAPGGRLAMVLPGTFLHAGYAEPLRQEILRRFKLTAIILLKERVFEDTQEESVILLTDGFGLMPESSRIGIAKSVEALEDICSDIIGKTKDLNWSLPGDEWLRSLLPRRVTTLYERLLKDERTSTFGDWAKIGIGTVTGANDFFVISKDAQEEWGITDRWVKPIVTRSAFLQGLHSSDEDWSNLDSNRNISTRIIDTNGTRVIPKRLQQYLKEGQKRGIDRRYKCRIRQPWHSVPICPPPSAFFKYMSVGGPRLVLNESKATSTNAIHVVNWHRRLSKRLESSIALSVLSSLSQLNAELVGRSYGGGVLKLEPSEARRLLIAIPPEGFPNGLATMRKVDRLLRSDNWNEAVGLVDKLVLEDYLGLGQSDIQRLRKQVSFLARRRRGKRNSISVNKVD